MLLVHAIIGLLLLLFGRRLFWFFVAAAGFVFGLFLAQEYLAVESPWLALAIALGAGLAGALLSFLLQKVAVAAAGFASGAYLGSLLANALGFEYLAWIGLVIGGVLGAVVLLLVFEWALIVLSSLLGAALVSAPELTGEAAPLVFLGALVLGIIAQTLQLSRTRRVPAPPPEPARHRQV